MAKNIGKIFSTSLGSMNDWADAFEKAGDKELANRLRESEAIKLSGLRVLKELGLPNLNRIAYPLTEFLRKSDKIFNNLGDGKYFISLVSDKWQDRKRAVDLTRDEAKTYVAKTVTEGKRRDYTVIISRYYENIYGGNIVINSHGRVVIEMVKGKHIKAATGKGQLAAIVECDQFLGRVKYYKFYKGDKREMQNKPLKKAIWQTLNCIPKDQVTNGERYFFHKGYYEFVLVRERPRSPLAPIFIDYRDDEKYQLRYI